MQKAKYCSFIAIVIALVLLLPVIASADDEIYALKIENIKSNGADIYWSTSVETIGSITYAYTKLPELYNPQSAGPSQGVLVTVVPAQTISEKYYVKAHHLRINNLDMNYDPIVQYTIKSQTSDGQIYTLSGEFVLVDTGKIFWWQTWQFSVGTFTLGLIIPLVIRLIQSRRKRPKVIAMLSPTCDLSFHEFDHSSGRQWRVLIHTRPPNGVTIKNAEGLSYRFEAKLTRLGLGSIVLPQGWNIGEKDKLHESPIDLFLDGIQSQWVSSNTSDWYVEVWVTVGSKRHKTLYKGNPTGINVTRD